MPERSGAEPSATFAFAAASTETESIGLVLLGSNSDFA